MRVVDEELFEHLAENEEERPLWLFLEAHDEFEGHWKVESFDSGFFFDFREIIGPYRAVSPSKLKKFMEVADELDYKVGFMEDPTEIMASYESLNEPPPFSLNSSFPNTINGMLPFQVQGFNALKDLRGGMAIHSTGTGKSRLASALVRNGQVREDTDLAIIVAKSHNLTNFQRSLLRDADLDSTVIAGPKAKRDKIYAELEEGLERGEHQVVVTNYEKWRVDTDAFIRLVEGRKVFILWDEMSVKLSNRDSALFKKIIEALYRIPRPYGGGAFSHKTRAASLRQVATTATPIEVSPEGLYNCFRILDPGILGTVSSFHEKYVKSFSRHNKFTPEVWHNLDRLGLELAHVIHQVDKSDPDIAKMFPDVIETEISVDWSDKERKIYDALTKDAVKHGLDEENPLAVITVLQMLCDAPSMVARSAEAWEIFAEEFEETGSGERNGSEVAAALVESLGGKELDDSTHTKFEALRELLVEKHPDEKAVVFATFNTALMPVLREKFEEWGVSYVQYDGTPTEKQQAQDTFMDDPSTQVFLSSDKGSDSLDLYEANVVINYDLPWNWSRLQQRNNRVHRIVSNHSAVYYYNLLMVDSVEDRKRELIERKKGFHDGVFRGTLADKSMSSRMTKKDLLYALRG